MGHMERGDIEALFGRDQSGDYTQGYGHLLFPPLEIERDDGVRKHKSRGTSKQKTSDCHDPKESLAATAETMQSASPLMRLPLELRYRIFGLLILPLLGSFYEDLPEMTGANGVRFRVLDASYNCSLRYPDPDFTHSTREPNGHHPQGMEDLFELYKAIREGVADDTQMQRGEHLCITPQFDTHRPIDEMSAVSTSDGEDHDDDLRDGEKEEGEQNDTTVEIKDAALFSPALIDLGACHPIYNLRVYKGPDIYDADVYPGGHSNDFHGYPPMPLLSREYQNVDFDFLRPLFHVSYQFTRDVGACLWQNAIVKFETPECFFPFIAPRPAIVNFIKFIELELQFFEDWFDTSSDTVVAICQFISEYMNLRYLRIHLTTEAHHLEKILTGEKLEKWTMAFKGLKVSQGFDVRVIDFPILWRVRRQKIWRPTPHPLGQKLNELWYPRGLGNLESTEVRETT
ncbi:hypothetical protein ACJ73_02387 [Blastomyces percursus]|uniref:Uncharacterized protein n=1 Tax=Blastomyces percursus TaxID=1658174 RepID=A0A1J9QDQ8_9EURO|nr:hypothetical protein ACJ73_02387 [Blastomyces percursus]